MEKAALTQQSEGRFMGSLDFLGNGDIGSGIRTSLTAFDPMDVFGAKSDAALAAQQNAANQANDTQRYMYDTTRSDLQPWREAGTGALSSLTKNDFMKDWQTDPGYQFRMDEGSKAINAAAAARGNYNSGATMKALARYGQDYASGEYNNAYQRQYNRLSGLAGIGNSTNSLMGQNGQNYANQVSQNQLGVGNAAASQQIAAANRNTSLVGSALTAGAVAYSDERLKTNIEPVSKEDLSEMKKHLKAYAFNYRSNEFGTGDWVGIMAQDLEKSKLGKTLVVEDENGHKMIDLKKVLSMFLATIAEA